MPGLVGCVTFPHLKRLLSLGPIFLSFVTRVPILMTPTGPFPGLYAEFSSGNQASATVKSTETRMGKAKKLFHVAVSYTPASIQPLLDPERARRSRQTGAPRVRGTIYRRSRPRPPLRLRRMTNSFPGRAIWAQNERLPLRPPSAQWRTPNAPRCSTRSRVR